MLLFPVSPTIIAPPASTPEHLNRHYDESTHLQLQRHHNWQTAQRQPQPALQPVQQQFVTKTVSGFMDFVTTVGNTVMVFTPAGQAGQEHKQKSRTRSPTGSL